MPFVSDTAQTPDPSPQQLIGASNHASNIREAGPYKLEAAVIFNPGQANQLNGRITAVSDKNFSRSELQLGGYRQVVWIKSDQSYVARSGYFPLVQRILPLDRFWRVKPLATQSQFSQVSKRNRGHSELNCFEVKQPKAGKQKMCFDSSTSLWAIDANPNQESEFLDYSRFGHHYFPQHIVLRDSGRTVLEVKDITVVQANVSPEAFNVPQGTLQFDYCEDKKQEEVRERVEPDYPDIDKAQHRQGTVYIYVLVAKDGAPTNLAVEAASYDSMAKSAMNAIKQWRFSPAMCGDKPVASETEIKISFFTR